MADDDDETLYLTEQIARCLRLARTAIDKDVADMLCEVAEDYKAQLERLRQSKGSEG